MNILALDTSAKVFSLAVVKDGKVVASRDIVLEGVLSSSIIPSIDAILKKAKLPFAKIDGFAVGLGPGSFTSLRVGLSTIKGFCLASGKPVVGISSLDLIAMNIKEPSKDICVLTDAKRNMVYAAIFTRTVAGLKRKSDYLLVEPKDLLRKIKAGTVFVGDGLNLYQGIIKAYCTKMGLSFVFEKEVNWMPSARQLCTLADARFTAKKTDNIDTLLPIYLYPEDCQVHR